MAIRRFETADQVARAAAEDLIVSLNEAIGTYGRAVWVLAGGSSPMAAYSFLTERYATAVNWSKVVVLIGDERFVPLSHKDSNWGSIGALFNADTHFATLQQLPPDIHGTVEEAATAYEEKIHAYDINHFDVVWLGVGEDGHTLSLFPNNPAFDEPTGRWVVPVHSSPKAPGERISLSLTALQNAKQVTIFATGAAKRVALHRVREGADLPIATAGRIAETHGAVVHWLYDADAWGGASS